MKNKLVKICSLLVILVCTSLSASAQVYVKMRPARPVVIKTATPGPGYIWVRDEWEPNGIVYRYTGGHWVVAPEKGMKWRKGYWRKYPVKGYVWIPGKWVRVR